MNEIIKILLGTLLCVGCFFGLIIFLLWLLPNTIGLLLGFIFGSLSLMLIMGFIYPIVFKEYIKEYWERQNESKDL